jgi:hypothetical protein
VAPQIHHSFQGQLASRIGNVDPWLAGWGSRRCPAARRLGSRQGGSAASRLPRSTTVVVGGRELRGEACSSVGGAGNRVAWPHGPTDRGERDVGYRGKECMGWVGQPKRRRSGSVLHSHFFLCSPVPRDHAMIHVYPCAPPPT